MASRSYLAKWRGILHGDDLHHYMRCTVMLNALADIRPLLLYSWCEMLHPPLIPQLSQVAFGIDLHCEEEAIDLLRWVDFLHSVYSTGECMSTPIEWRNAWIARSRVVHRYTK